MHASACPWTYASLGYVPCPCCMCSIRAALVLSCARALVHKGTQKGAVWLVCTSHVETAQLLLPPGVVLADSAFDRIDLRIVDGRQDFVKLCASMHVLPAEELPGALLIDDSAGQLIGTNERACMHSAQHCGPLQSANAFCFQISRMLRTVSTKRGRKVCQMLCSSCLRKTCHLLVYTGTMVDRLLYQVHLLQVLVCWTTQPAPSRSVGARKCH